MNSRFAFWMAAAMAGVPLAAYADPAKVEYELAERCGKTAGEWFKGAWPDPIGPHGIASYENHYNRKLNRCLVLFCLKSVSGQKSQLSLSLFDANENKTFGEFAGYVGVPSEKQYGFDCYVGENRCRSETEWRALAKPFMED